mgnify:CR=1 FL=1
MAQYNSVFSNQVNQTPSLTGEETIRVDQIDFDTTCPCQITACDGGTIKVCAKMEIEDLVIDSLCTDSVTVKDGLTNGLKFSTDPCNVTGESLVYVKPSPGNSGLVITAPVAGPTNGQLHLISNARLGVETPDDIEFKFTNTASPQYLYIQVPSPPAEQIINMGTLAQNGWAIYNVKSINGILVTPTQPATSKGSVGDKAGSVFRNQNFSYFCYSDFTSGFYDIWNRTTVTDTGAW